MNTLLAGSVRAGAPALAGVGCCGSVLHTKIARSVRPNSQHHDLKRFFVLDVLIRPSSTRFRRSQPAAFGKAFCKTPVRTIWVPLEALGDLSGCRLFSVLFAN
jgi:hypothetical protein